MKIRKKFNVESAHIVRNCSSERCSHSIHGHSATIELVFESRTLDNAQMVVDFGLMKSTIKSFVDAMDHTYLLCTGESEDYKSFIKNECDRWIEMDFNPSAEMLSMYVFSGVQNIIKSTSYTNGEDSTMKLVAVRYHETATGWAECNEEDVENLFKVNPTIYSPKITEEITQQLVDVVNGKMLNNIRFLSSEQVYINPVIPQQIQL